MLRFSGALPATGFSGSAFSDLELHADMVATVNVARIAATIEVLYFILLPLLRTDDSFLTSESAITVPVQNSIGLGLIWRERVIPRLPPALLRT